MKYAFADEFQVVAMCRAFEVQRSGYYAWLKEPQSERAKADERLLGLVKRSWLDSGDVYGHRKVTLDLRDLGRRAAAIALSG